MNKIVSHLRSVLENIPHVSHRLYDTLATTPPILTILIFILLLMTLMAVKHYYRALVLAAISMVFLSFLIFAPGRAVLRQAWQLPTTQRPVCLGDALIHGAVWSRAQLKSASHCRPAPTKHQKDAADQVDSAADGILSGTINNDEWTAQITLPPLVSTREALTRDRAGTRSVYLLSPTLVWRVSTCPSLGGVPEQFSGDNTGKAYADFFYQHVPLSSFSAVIPLVKHINYTSTQHLYKLSSSGQLAIAYLFPVSGQEGRCAIINGPYVRHGRGFSLARPTSSASASLERLAGVIHGDRLAIKH